MAYDLTLTRSERAAFDWVGGRYNAYDVARILWAECTTDTDEPAWDGPEDITYHIPEWAAWSINELAEQEDYTWPCFAAELREKLNALCFAIV